MSSPMLHQLLYVSQARIDPCGPHPRHILQVASERNAALGVTGLLCFSGDHFAQYLEGPAAAITTLMSRIRQDERHHIEHEWPMQRADATRRFPGWSMGYVYDERLESLLRALGGHADAIPALRDAAEQLVANLDQYQVPIR